MKDRIAKSVFWIAWSRGALQIVSFLSTLIVARLLSPADYGLMALAMIWTSTLALISEMGVDTAIVQFRDLEERELNACFWLTMCVAGVGYLALYAAAPAIAAWFASPRLSDVLRVVGLTLPLVAFRVIPGGLLRKRLAFDKVSQAEIASTVVSIPLVLGMAWVGFGVWALVAGALAMPLVQGIASFWFVRWWPGLRVGGRRLQEILRYSLTTLGANVSWAVYYEADSFVLGTVSGEVVLGFYSMARQLAILPVTKVSVAVNQLAMPVMAELQADLRAMRASFLRVLRMVACLTVPLCIGMALVADDLVWIALGDKWLSIVPVLQVLCFYALIRSLDNLLPPVLFARYRAAFLFWWTVGLLLVMPFVFWAGAAWMGAVGVAMAHLVVYPFLMAWMARQVFSELDIGWRTIWDQVRPVVGAVLVMVGVVLVIRWTIPGSDFVNRLLRLTLASGMGALVYGFGIIWRGGPIAGEFREVAGWLLRPRTPVAAGK